jgi:hypothetical protein
MWEEIILCWTYLKNIRKICCEVAGYRLIDHRRNEDIREEIQIIDINSRIEDYQMKWLQHLGRMEQNRIPKLLLNYKPRGRRVQGRPCRRWREQF